MIEVTARYSVKEMKEGSLLPNEVEVDSGEVIRYFSESADVRLKPSSRDDWGTCIIFPDAQDWNGRTWTVKRSPDVIAREIDEARQ